MSRLICERLHLWTYWWYPVNAIYPDKWSESYGNSNISIGHVHRAKIITEIGIHLFFLISGLEINVIRNLIYNYYCCISSISYIYFLSWTVFQKKFDFGVEIDINNFQRLRMCVLPIMCLSFMNLAFMRFLWTVKNTRNCIIE